MLLSLVPKPGRCRPPPLTSGDRGDPQHVSLKAFSGPRFLHLQTLRVFFPTRYGLLRLNLKQYDRHVAGCQARNKLPAALMTSCSSASPSASPYLNRPPSLLSKHELALPFRASWTIYDPDTHLRLWCPGPYQTRVCGQGCVLIFLGSQLTSGVSVQLPAGHSFG